MMAVVQRFDIDITDWQFDQEGGSVTFTRDQAEALWQELGTALGYDELQEGDNALLLRMNEVERALVTIANAVAGGGWAGQEAPMEGPSEYMVGDVPFEEQQGRPAGPTRTLTAEQMEKAMEKRMAAEQAGIAQVARARGGGKNPGSGIGSGKGMGR